MWRSVVKGAVLAAVLAGCSIGSHTTSSTAKHAAALPTRTCDTGVSGTLPRGWKSSSLRAGSVWLYLWGAVRDGGRRGLLSPSRFAAVSPGEFHPWKMMVIVPAGHSVVVRVAPASVRRLRLAFQLPGQDPSGLGNGQVAVRFVPCQQGRTYYNGGVIVAGAQCAEFQVAGPSPTPISLTAAFGRTQCP
jgi:hypothetical protein